jgi:ubiquinone/menaquinone biosynthesis C-methylase UbiE
MPEAGEPDMKMDQKSYLERERDYWEARTEFEWLSEREIRVILDIIPPMRGDILELCSGSGMFTKYIPERFRSYTCLDLSQSMLDGLHQMLPNITPVLGNAENLYFPPSSFDMVLVFAGLHHIPNEDLAIQNAYTVLRPGGAFVAFEPNDSCWYRRPMLKMKSLLDLYTADERFLKPNEMISKMKMAGFVDITTKYRTPEYNPAHLRTFINKFLSGMMQIASSLSDAPNWQSFFVITGKK